MLPHIEDVTPLPPFAKPLVSYIKSRQEALKIRRVLTLYLQTQVVFSEATTGSHLSLSTSYNVVAAKRTPKELTGLRKEYLKAVQEHVAAKKQCDDLAYEAGNRKREAGHTPTQHLGNGQELQNYRALLHDRRRREKLQIFHHYLEELDRKQAARPNYLDIQGGQKPHAVPSENFDPQLSPGTGTRRENGEDLETIIYNLEKAVVRAKQQLDQEKKLLEKLKQSSEGKSGRKMGESGGSSAKIEALQRTRDELVRWVEERLATSGSGELDSLENDELGDPPHSLEAQKTEIKKHYDAYIEARGRLLTSASMTSLQNTANETTKAKLPDEAVEEHRRSTCPDSVNLLPYANDILLPLYKAQKALGLQKSYVSAVMSREKSSTCRTLDRLNDESHLIPSYPILARQPRFQHAVTAIKPRTLDSIASEQGSTQADEVVGHAQAWAFASEAARGNTSDYIEERARLGSEAAENAQETLKEVYEIMNQDHSEAIHVGEEEKQEEADIWTTDVKAGKNRSRPARPEKPKGPWSGLNGRVGLV